MMVIQVGITYGIVVPARTAPILVVFSEEIVISNVSCAKVPSIIDFVVRLFLTIDDFL